MPLASKVMGTPVKLVAVPLGLPAIAVALPLPVTDIRLPVEQLAGFTHTTPQFTVAAPVSAASHALVVVPVLTARR